jgi:hypothetical protein
MSLGIRGWEKCTLLTKPEQSGKTFLMLQKIVEDFSEEPREDGKKNVNFILCDNNLLLVLQTSVRLNTDEELRRFRNTETGELYVEFSSSKRTNANTSDSVFRLITTGDIQNIISCSNGTRCHDIFKIIRDINKVSYMKDRFHFNIWFDEADKFINLIKDYMIPAIENFDNLSFYPITATPEKIINYFKEINIWSIENPTLENYHGWNDNNITLYDNDITQKNELFVDLVLKSNTSEIKPNTRWFIPANMFKKSHLAIKDICRTFGFATMIINGDGIMVYLPNGKIIECEKNDIPDTLIPKIYNQYKLYKYPFAITGYQCISRGISISSNKFMLSHSIMPMKISNKSELSQIAGRMKGNQKGWRSYKVPKVYCSSHFSKIAKQQEEKTIKLAKIAFEEDWQTVTLEKFKMVEKDYYYYQHPNGFNTYLEALEYLATQESHMKMDIDKSVINVAKLSRKPHCHQTPNGYWLTSKIHKKNYIIENKNNIENMRLTDDSLKEMSLGSNLSAPSSQNASYIIYPVYDNLETLAENVKYYVRHTVRKKINTGKPY